MTRPCHRACVSEFSANSTRWQLVNRQIRDLEQERAKKIRDNGTPHVEPVRRLLGLKGIGANGAWLLVRGILRLASDQEPSRTGEPGGTGADAVRQR